MKGDHLYCEHCENVYIDIEEVHDTRRDKKFKPMCPYCGAWKSVNIEGRLIELEAFKQDPDKTNINIEKDRFTKALVTWRLTHVN